jgi:DNA mismatch repair ATPase MutS
VVLAQAGAPVCAASLTLPPLDVRTSVRVEDSLERGVSLFMAELLRLRDVVEAARRSHATGGRTVLFLLDEILHGTNTAERQIAARRILASLVEQGAIGAVTTHDLALADAEPLRSLARAVHFTERFEPASGGRPARMTFDYVLREGVATSVNALRLVEMMGLG